MDILVTMPGRHGDILWSLATARAIAEGYGAKVTFAISGKYGSLEPLIASQPYVKKCLVLASWAVQETAPMSPRIPPYEFQHDRCFHLGYGGWPELPLPYECERIAKIASATYGEPNRIAPVDLTRPWVHAEPWMPTHPVVVGWSDEWFELKYGLTRLAERQIDRTLTGFLLCGPGSRWELEGGFIPTPWIDDAMRLAGARVFLGCCSALHVLAAAVGVPKLVIVEPNPQRHHNVFYPLGKADRVQLLLGGDGQPTFDARHLVDALTGALHGA